MSCLINSHHAERNKMQKIIHLDLDGVLYDMNGRVKQLVGKLFTEFDTRREAWAALKPHVDMFKDIDLLPDALLLVEGVEKFAKENNYKVEVLTAVPLLANMPNAETHKKESVQKHFGHLGWKFKIGPHAKDKQDHCKPGDILIDDSKINIEQWNTKGGIGIYHTSAITTLEILNGTNALKQTAGKRIT